MNPTRRIRGGAPAPSPCGKLRARLVAVAIAASAALVLAGCGGSSSPTTSTAAAHSPGAAGGGDAGVSSPRAGLGQAALKFARCIRSHGISDFPDPASSGQLTLPPDDRNTPAFESASKACQSLMPGGAGGAGQTSTMSRGQELQLAKCMRSHGVPNFPDPNASGAIPPGSVNPNSPAVKAALNACLPASAPSQAP